MKDTDKFLPYIEESVKEHPGMSYTFSLLRKLDKEYFDDLKKEVFKQKAEHSHAGYKEKQDMVSTVADRINNSQVVTKNRHGRLGTALMSDKKRAYKPKTLKYKIETNRVNVKKKRDRNMDD